MKSKPSLEMGWSRVDKKSAWAGAAIEGGRRLASAPETYSVDGNSIVDDKMTNHFRESVSYLQTGFTEREIGPSVTVITVVYNDKEGLIETIDSVCEQSYPFVEHVIVDGGSTDGTLDVLKARGGTIDYWISKPDNGLYYAMNDGISYARGEWICFLNAGDTFDSSESLLIFSSYLSQDYGLVYGDTRFVNKKNGRVIEQISMDFTFENLIRYTTGVVCHQSMLFNSRVVPLFDIRFRLKAELKQYFSLAEMGVKVKKVDLFLSRFAVGGAGTRYVWRNTVERVKVVFAVGGMSGLWVAKYEIIKDFIRRIALKR